VLVSKNQSKNQTAFTPKNHLKIDWEGADHARIHLKIGLAIAMVS
jgi:hypothetical protein